MPPRPAAPPVDDEDAPAPKATAAAREWVGSPESERRANELREAIRAGGWPEDIPDPNDPDDPYVPARPVSADEITEFARLVSKRELRLQFVILRRRITGWLDQSETEHVSGDEMIADVVTVIDEMIENAGGHERGSD